MHEERFCLAIYQKLPSVNLAGLVSWEAAWGRVEVCMPARMISTPQVMHHSLELSYARRPSSSHHCLRFKGIEGARALWLRSADAELWAACLS